MNINMEHTNLSYKYYGYYIVMDVCLKHSPLIKRN